MDQSLDLIPDHVLDAPPRQPDLATLPAFSLDPLLPGPSSRAGQAPSGAKLTHAAAPVADTSAATAAPCGCSSGVEDPAVTSEDCNGADAIEQPEERLQQQPKQGNVWGEGWTGVPEHRAQCGEAGVEIVTSSVGMQEVVVHEMAAGEGGQGVRHIVETSGALAHESANRVQTAEAGLCGWREVGPVASAMAGSCPSIDCVPAEGRTGPGRGRGIIGVVAAATDTGKAHRVVERGNQGRRGCVVC